MSSKKDDSSSEEMIEEDSLWEDSDERLIDEIVEEVSREELSSKGEEHAERSSPIVSNAVILRAFIFLLLKIIGRL